MNEVDPSKTNVLLLSAGLGTRLKPITDTVPKPLVEVGGKPLICWHLERLQREGFKKVFVNVHYLGQLIKDYLGNGSKWSLEIEVVSEDPILDTGGAIKNISRKITSEQLLVINSDAFFGADFSALSLLRYHVSKAGIVTLVVRRSPQAKTYGVIGLDKDQRISQFLNVATGLEMIDEVMFAGAQVIEKNGFSYFDRFGSIFSLTRDYYSMLVSNGAPLYGMLYSGYWNDVGTAQRLAEVELELKQGS